MRIMLPNGTVMTVEKAIAFCEKRVAFNGRVERLCERAADLTYANALGFFSDAQGSFNVVTGGTTLICNLAPEFVREVLESLTRDGYINLSSLKLQKKQPLTSQYVFDNGASGGYILQGLEADMNCTGYPFVNGPIPTVSEVEDADEDDAEDEDAGEEDCNE